MSEYDGIRTKKLILKGEKPKKKRKRQKDDETEKQPKVDHDAIAHGNWRKINCIENIKGSVAIEMGKSCYIKALDNGLFMLGAPHESGEGPYPEEILTAIPVDDKTVAFKSGYGKYLSVNKTNIVIGRSDAIGPREQWEPIFEKGKLALLAYTNCFMSVDSSDDSVVAVSKKVDENALINIRSQAVVIENPIKDVPKEEQGNLEQVEVNYVRKFQKFQDKRLKICQEDKSELEKAKESGIFHEKLLDRRSKMKSDRYCK